MTPTGGPAPSHEPAGYECPFCFLLAGGETALDSPRDIILQTARATALIASQWQPGSPGHVIVIPNRHYENIYDLPDAYGHAVHDAVRQVAIAMREAYDCAGISIRQHNEPAGGQEIWHHHVHVIPRHQDDSLHQGRPARTSHLPTSAGPMRSGYGSSSSPPRSCHETSPAITTTLELQVAVVVLAAG